MKKLSTGQVNHAYPKPEDYFYQDMGPESLFRTGEFLKDRDNDTIPDTRVYHVQLPDDPYCREAWELLETRLLQECGNGECDETENVIRFTGRNIPSVSQISHPGYTELCVDGSGEELVSFMRCFVKNFDCYELCSSMEEITVHLRDTFAGRNSDGEKIYEVRRHDICVLEQEYHVSGETEEMKRLISEADYEDQDLVFELAVSKPKETRKDLEKTVHERFPNAAVRVLNAYKQGFSWLEEVCLPILKNKTFDRIVIGFVQDGVWKDTDGSVPVRTVSKGTDSAEQMELPIRFLQELYPIDDVLAEELQISRDRITFELLEEEGITYRITAYQNDEAVYTDTYNVCTYERYFLDAYPEKGTVHPATGYFRVRRNDTVLTEQTVRTDRDRIYDVYQEQILPALSACRNDAFRNEQRLSKILMKIGLEETERNLPFRQDRISPADGLMEDLYFTTLEYFAQKDLEEGKQNDEAGLIMPDVTLRAGSPSCSLTVTVSDQSKVYDTNVFLESVSFQDDSLVYHYRAEGVSDEVISQWCQRCENGQLLISEHLSKKGIFELNGHIMNSSSIPQIIQDLDPADLEIPDTVITPEMLDDIMDRFRRVRGIHVHVIGESYERRPVYAVSFEDTNGTRYEKRLNRCNILINARHHANEVSSTNAVLQLIKELLCGEQRLPGNMNLVIIPMENPDGAAIHASLCSKHPFYKLHMARFNALGREFARDVFTENTVHTEARAVYRLYREYVFDAVIDEHGVPSHEWEQTFSGYTSPSYRGFWLPRAVLYGYFWYTSVQDREEYRKLMDRIEQAVSEKICEDTELKTLNEDWKDRFEKYAHAWMPAMFPAEYRYDMIHYHIIREQNNSSFYVTQKYPWLHSLYYTSEVPDETVHDKALAQCIRAHLADEHAILEILHSLCRNV